VGLGLLGTGASLYLYYLLLEEFSAVAAASAIYITPVVSLAIGWAAGEHIGLVEAFGVTLILGCLMLVEAGRQRAERVTLSPRNTASMTIE
jgi:drug/metabolite transporter (DMT)-like permease